MTITRIVTLLSVIALLASLPLTVALAQGQAPFTVVGSVMIDDAQAGSDTMVVAMVGEEKVAEGMVDADGMYKLEFTMGDVGDSVMFSVMMGEEGMMYEAMPSQEIMIGEKFDLKKADLMAYSDPENMPAPAAPTKTATEEMEAMRGATGRPGSAGPQGEMGPQGESGAKGNTGARGPAGPDGATGDTGNAGAKGDTGNAGAGGSAGSAGSDGAKGATGDAGPAGPPGSAGAAGEQGASGGGVLAIVALIVAIVGVVAAGGAFIAGRNSG